MDENFLAEFNLVIGTSLSFKQATEISTKCQNFIFIDEFGFIAAIRTYTKGGVEVVESKPDSKEVLDLRVHRPFPELLKFC